MSEFLAALKKDVADVKGEVEKWADPVGKKLVSVIERIVGLFEAGVAAQEAAKATKATKVGTGDPELPAHLVDKEL